MEKKTKMEQNLEQLLDLPEESSIASKKDYPVRPAPPSTSFSGDIDTDYRYARENLYEIIENGSHALHELVEIAKASEHPRAFEVVASLMKTLTDANKDLIDIQGKVKKLKEETPQQQGPNNVTNALFVGSTAELQALLNNEKDISNE
jgi:hypothetical protein